MSGEDNVAFRLLHTADWHLGKRFPSFDETAQTKLRRARLDVLHKVFAEATRYGVDAVLCAGDLFDEPKPHQDWWRGLLDLFRKLRPDFPRIYLLPGNHDPLLPGSIWTIGHSFRDGLPAFVRVVDREDFQDEIKPGLVLYAVPCCSKAGAADPVEKIPPRAEGDDRVRVGLVHGTTFDLPGYEMNFPIRADSARARGLNYLAIGDTHGFRVVQDDPPVVYPGAPEPTAFDESDPGNVVLVWFSTQGRSRLQKVPVANWGWRDEVVRDLPSLRALATVPNLNSTVLRLAFDIDVSLAERDEIEQILGDLGGNEARHGRAGVLDCDRVDLRMRVDSGLDAFPPNLPPVLQKVIDKLHAIASASDAQATRRAQVALYQLSKLIQPRAPR
jgi:DNA repair exonuclease SbcCD nuclease subunit